MSEDDRQDQPMPAGPLEVDSPIINSPFYPPQHHWRIEKGARPVKAEGRRPASYYFRVPEHAQRGRKPAKGQEGLFGDAEVGQEEDLALVHWLLIHLESQLLTLLIMVFFLNVFLIQREYRCQILILISAWKKEIA